MAPATDVQVSVGVVVVKTALLAGDVGLGTLADGITKPSRPLAVPEVPRPVTVATCQLYDWPGANMPRAGV